MTLNLMDSVYVRSLSGLSSLLTHVVAIANGSFTREVGESLKGEDASDWLDGH